MARSPREIRWAPRLRPILLRRLYEADARGIRDEPLCDDVATRLYERCRSLLLVQRRALLCPGCGAELRIALRDESRCSACTWSTTWDVYWRSVQNHDAAPGRAVEAYQTYTAQFPLARGYGAKLIAIDQLIHGFHRAERTRRAVKSVASKLLEGNKKDVVRFLDQLSALDPAAKARWRERMAGTIDARLVR